MTSGILLSSLLFGAIGLLGAGAPRGALKSVFGAAVLLALAASFLAQGLAPKAVTVLAALSIVPPVILIYLPRVVSVGVLTAVAANSAFWAGAVLSGPGEKTGLAFAILWLAVWLPARWMIRRRWQIGLKVAASWMLAIALLAVSLNTISMPSYQLDHME